MIFLGWLLIHIAACIAQGIIVGVRPQQLRWSEKALVALWYSIPLSWFLVQKEPSPGLFTAGFVLYALGAALLTWARIVNPYFQPAIVMPPKVITTGPYRLKHPGYAAMVMMALGSLWMLASPIYGYLLLAVYSAILMLRAQEENRVLLESTQEANHQRAQSYSHD